MSKVVVKVEVSAEYIAEGCYTELVAAYGYEFAVHFVNSQFNIYGTQSLAYDRRPRWQFNGAVKAVKEYAAAKVASLGEEFMNKHIALYAEEAA